MMPFAATWVEVEIMMLSEVKVAQSCLTLCNPMDYAVHGILQARILEWVAFPFSSGSSRPRDRTRGLLHFRWILYQLSYQGSPDRTKLNSNLAPM